MPACCARSASTAPRPISTPTCRRIITSISKTITNWSTFRIRIWCCRRCRKCPRVTRSPGSTWSSGCARSAEFYQRVVPAKTGTHNHKCLFFKEGVYPIALADRPRRMGPRVRGDNSRIGFAPLLHLLIGIDAPQPLLFDPAVEAVADDVAPAGRAALDLGHDAGLQARDD